MDSQSKAAWNTCIFNIYLNVHVMTYAYCLTSDPWFFYYCRFKKVHNKYENDYLYSKTGVCRRFCLAISVCLDIPLWIMLTQVINNSPIRFWVLHKLLLASLMCLVPLLLTLVEPLAAHKNQLKLMMRQHLQHNY